MLDYLVLAIGIFGFTVGVSVSIWSYRYTRRKYPPARKRGQEKRA